jgi:hypothetical protein
LCRPPGTPIPTWAEHWETPARAVVESRSTSSTQSRRRRCCASTRSRSAWSAVRRCSRSRSAPESAAPVTPHASSTRPSRTTSPAARARSSTARPRATRSARSLAWSWSTRPIRSSSLAAASVASARPLARCRTPAEVRPVHPWASSRDVARTRLACPVRPCPTERAVEAHADRDAGSPGTTLTLASRRQQRSAPSVTGRWRGCPPQRRRERSGTRRGRMPSRPPLAGCRPPGPASRRAPAAGVVPP